MMLQLQPNFVFKNNKVEVIGLKVGNIRPSVDGLYRDGTVHISREMHKQCFITRRETTSRAPKLALFMFIPLHFVHCCFSGHLG